MPETSNETEPFTATVNRVPFEIAKQTYETALALSQPRTCQPITLHPGLLPRLAREVAMDMRELPDVLEIFKLTGEQYARIAATEFFQQTLALARIEWTSAVNTAERIKIEAAAALEDALPALSARMSDSYENLTAAVEAGKLFAKLAGLGERDASGGHAGEKFTININLGEGQEIKFEKDVTPTSAGALSVDTKGEGHTSPV